MKLTLRGGADEGQHTADTDKAVLEKLQSMRNERKAVVEKISSLEEELEDHEMVSTILSDFPPSRRCYRTIGGVLMERSVADIVPEIRSEWVKLSKALVDLKNMAEEQCRAIDAFQQEHAIVVRNSALAD